MMNDSTMLQEDENFKMACQSMDIFYNKKKRKRVTHIFYTNGKLSVYNEKKLMNFYNLYANYIKLGKRLFVAEKIAKKEPTRFFVDFDINKYDRSFSSISKELSNPDYFIPHIQLICKTVFEQLAPKPISSFNKKAIICRKSPSENNGEICHNYHIIFPYIYSENVEQDFLNWAVSIAASLTAKYPGHPWTSIIDKTVYKKGLRLIGSGKTIKCQSCYKVVNKHKKSSKEEKEDDEEESIIKDLEENLQKDRCPECEDRKFTIDSRAYFVWKVIYGDDQIGSDITDNYLVRLKEDYQYAISQTRLGLFKCEVINIDLQNKESDETLDSSSSISDHPNNKRQQQQQQVVESKRNIMENISTDTLKHLQNWLLEHTPYEKVVSMIKMNQHCIHINVYPNYCHNIQGCHKSNNVYLKVTSKKVEQYCFCRCVKPEKKTQCEMYRFHLVDFPDYLIKNILPVTTTTAAASFKKRKNVVVVEDPSVQQKLAKSSSIQEKEQSHSHYQFNITNLIYQDSFFKYLQEFFNK